MRKKFLLKGVALAMALSLSLPVTGVRNYNGVTVNAETLENATSTKELKIPPRVTEISGNEASSWSPATITLSNISKYDDNQKGWINGITSITVNGVEYAHADYDSLDVEDTKKYAFSWQGIQIVSKDINEGTTTIVIKSEGYKNKTIVFEKNDGQDIQYTIKSQKNGDDIVNTDTTDTTVLENTIIDAKAIEKADKTDEKWEALQSAIASAQESLTKVTTAEEVTDATTKLNNAINIFNRDTKGPEIKNVKYNSDSKRVYFEDIDKYNTVASEYISAVTSVIVNGVEYKHAENNYFDSEDENVASQYGFTYYGLEIGMAAVKSGDNKIIIKADTYDDKTIEFKKVGDDFTFISQKDGEVAGDTEKITNPTEDGVYTLTYSAKEEGKDTDSMITGVFDKRAKLTVENGKMTVSMLNTSLKEYFVDFSLGTDSEYVESTVSDWGDVNKSGEYEAQEFKIPVKDITSINKAAALVIAMGGQKSDIHQWDKYRKADFKFTSVTEGWNGYQKEEDDANRPSAEKTLKDALIEAGYDSNNDGDISVEEIQNISGEVDLSYKNLTDVSLLKNLTDKVEILNLSGNDIKEIPEGFFNNMTGLTDFYAEYNEISKIPENAFKNNANLNWISLAGNDIENVSDNQFSGLGNLTILDLGNNNITEISENAFKGLNKLEQLGLSENPLTDIKNGTFDDIADSLTFLGMEGGNLTKIPNEVSKLKKVENLSFFANELTDISNIDFSVFENLKTLSLQYNEINKIGTKGFSKNKKLESLDLYDNQLTTITKEMLPEGVVLHKLDVRLNNIMVIDPEVRKMAKSFNKFYPQKTAVNLTVSKNGKSGIKWNEDIKGLDLVFWNDETSSDRKEEIISTAGYREMLEANGWNNKKIEDVLNDNGYDWDVVTYVEKKNANGEFEIVDKNIASDTDEPDEGVFNTNENGTYRVVKVIYTLTSGTEKTYRTTIISNEFIFDRNEQQATEKVTDKADNKIQATTTGDKKVKVAKIKKVSAKSKIKKSVKLNWMKVKNISGYEIYRSTKKKGKYKLIKIVNNAKKVKYINKKLKSNKKYFYKIRAYKKVGKEKAYGAFSKVISVKVK